MGRLLGSGPAVLEIRLDGARYRFDSPSDFDFCLRARTSVPAVRVNELFDRAVAEFNGDTKGLRKLERTLLDLQERTLGQVRALPALLRELDVTAYTTDHDWRALFTDLLRAPDKRAAYIAVAVNRYIEYLRARQCVLRALAELRDEAEGCGAESRTSVFAAPAARIDVDEEPSVLRRLPHGRAVMLRLEHGREVTIALARHRFAIAHDRGWALIADGGQRYALRDGVNSVGRGRENSIAVDSALRNVSRKHLLVEPIGNDALVLTDLSSTGTFIPQTAIAS